MIRSLILALALMLGACSGSNSDSAAAPGGVTAGEARALDDAAQMIDDQRLPAGAVPSAQPATQTTVAQPAATKPAATKPAGPQPAG